MKMRITDTRLRSLIRETLESEMGSEESYEEEEYGSLSPTNKWLGEIPDGVLTTCSNEPIPSIRDTSRSCGYSFKPRGLWYAPGREWVDWMRYEMPNWLNNINYVYRIVPSGTVLKLQTEQEVRDFHNKFRTRDDREINWPAVTERYDGIEINPYQLDLRYSDVKWYYTWDLASGCIWRPGGVSDLELIATRPGV